MHIIRVSTVFALGLLFLPALKMPVIAQKSRARSTKQAVVRFEFDVKLDENEVPRSRVFVRVNGKRFFVSSFQEGFQTLHRAEWASRKVPRQALAACTGWWAGAGDTLYVLRRGAYLDVYQQEMDEQAASGPYRKIKTIPLRARRPVPSRR